MNSRIRSLLTGTALRLALALAVLSGVSCRSMDRAEKPSDPTPTSASGNRNVRYGFPAPASSNDREAYLLDRPEYVLSYNDATKIPNWVSWNLLRRDIGDSPRGSFEADPLIPKGYKAITASYYDNSGFDRGHMCNSKDRTDTPEHNDATFYMTNIVPQAPNNNQQGWEELESYCRELAQKGNELYIVCGPHGIGGEGKNGRKDAIGKNGIDIQVPAAVWKVVLVVPEGSPPTKQSRTIAVWMPNDQSVNTDWNPHIVSVSEVEKRTGYTFFPKLDPSVAREIKSRVDAGESHDSKK